MSGHLTAIPIYLATKNNLWHSRSFESPVYNFLLGHSLIFSLSWVSSGQTAGAITRAIPITNRAGLLPKRSQVHDR